MLKLFASVVISDALFSRAGKVRAGSVECRI